jgi:2-iminobutanoate/2-iminopropanoate deaminase
MQTRQINADDAPKPAGAYAQAVEATGATRMLFISGQVGVDLHGGTPADAVAQNRLVWTNLTAQLRAAGMTVDNLVKITTILPDFGDLQAARIARGEFMGDRRIASTLIVAGLANPAWKVEVEAIAVA